MPATYEQVIQFRRDWMAGSLKAANDWMLKGHLGWELSNMYHAVEHAMTLAVLTCNTPETGIAFLQENCRGPIIDRTFQLIRRIHVGEGDSNWPPPSIDVLIHCVHVAWLLGMNSEAKEFAALCGDESHWQHYQVYGLWQDFAHGIAAVAHNLQFKPAEKNYKGYDRHWFTYLRLMADICAGADLGEAIRLVDESFVKRNRDKRVMEHGINGNGTHPVKWDLRKHSLLIGAACHAHVLA